ncbi:TetR/AcrR family transcriptional regulator [Nitratireductor sp. XY-223]|uniref:TetR/AcrR family transcriptional regulator n=1 Tax=Nitratireductor sp. XY-223 TaxID=2561926 RepID=UPI001FEDBBAF|nr:TetR/AcrR family transcriptional regulator [Nitratireductor sp. XY-223]
MDDPLPVPDQGATKTSKDRRKRMNPSEREALIVDGAIGFFAEYGFEGKTRDLAKRLGITQPLLYRYFPSKESLIERVYQEIYLQRWNSEWESLIPDRNRPLADRLTTFYRQYARAVYDFVWVRIFLYSGLKGVDINDRYLAIIKDKILVPVCRELRHEHGLPSMEKVPITSEELELVWGLHGMFFYRAVRHFAYGLPIAKNIDRAIENDVRIFVTGARAIHGSMLENADG